MSFTPSGPVRRDYEVSVEIEEDKPEEVSVVCEESFPGAAMSVLEVYRDVGGTIRDVYHELDIQTIDIIGEKCERIEYMKQFD